MSFILLAQDAAMGDKLEQWTANNGLAVVLLFIMLLSAAYATIKVSRWLATNLVIPMRDAAISHLQKTDASLTSVSAAMQDITVQIREIKGDQTRIMEVHQDLRNRIHCQLKGNSGQGIPGGV